MNDNIENSENPIMATLDENTRRHYLDVMGIQCWQLRDIDEASAEVPESLVTQVSEVSKTPAPTVISDQDKWLQLDVSVQQCNVCQLHEQRKQAIIGRGNLSADLMFVLLAPNSNDDDIGTLCNGEANALFSKMLSAINISMNDVYVTSLLKCCVPDTHTITPKQIQSCNAHLNKQVQLIQPKRVVVLGEATIRCLLQNDLALDDYRALNNESQSQFSSVPIFTSYSPYELIAKPENKRKAWSDLQQLKQILES